MSDRDSDPDLSDDHDAAAGPDPVTQALFDVSERLIGFDERLGAEWIDGFLTAVAAGPRAIGRDEWLPALCGDAFERCFSDPDDAERAARALSDHFDTLRQALDPEPLLDDPDQLRLSPLMLPWDDEARAQAVAQGLIGEEEAALLQTGIDWMAGFGSALQAFEDDWAVPDDADADELLEMLADVLVLGLDVRSAEYAEHVAEAFPDSMPGRDDLVDAACFAVQDLRLWWLDHAPRTAPRRVAPAPGRNDPCPCGSGRKYKKCCGAAA